MAVAAAPTVGGRGINPGSWVRKSEESFGQEKRGDLTVYNAITGEKVWSMGVAWNDPVDHVSAQVAKHFGHRNFKLINTHGCMVPDSILVRDVSTYRDSILPGSPLEAETASEATEPVLAFKIVENFPYIIPEDWGWPSDPFSPDELLAYLRSGDSGAVSDQIEDERLLQKGHWYLFPNAGDGGNVYIHNFTKITTKTQPANFTVQLTDKEKKRLGVFIMDLPERLRNVYDSKKQLPIVFGSLTLCDMIAKFADFAQEQHFLDATKLRRPNPKVLEESRKAIVSAMRYGKSLCVYVGDDVCDFSGKVCGRKNAGSIPRELFKHGGLDQDSVKEAIYRDEDRESGICVVRPGFMVYLLAAYAHEGSFEMTPAQEADFDSKIPNFEAMEMVRCYCDDDKVALLQRNQRKSLSM